MEGLRGSGVDWGHQAGLSMVREGRGVETTSVKLKQPRYSDFATNYDTLRRVAPPPSVPTYPSVGGLHDSIRRAFFAKILRTS